MRLDKFLSERTAYSRSQVKDLIAAGKVKVNGVSAAKANMNVSGSDKVTVLGKPVRSEKALTLLLNKPAGCVSATDDKLEKTVIDLLPDEYKGQNLSPVGRLDKDTTGFLLLTNDGELLHALTSPKKHIPKYYIASLARPFTEEARAKIAHGLTLRDGTVCKPAEAAAIDKEGRKVLICLHEGKYHQVKRMMAAVGNHVESLQRIGMGGMLIPENMVEGEAFILLNKDLLKVLNSEADFSALLQSLGKSSS